MAPSSHTSKIFCSDPKPVVGNNKSTPPRMIPQTNTNNVVGAFIIRTVGFLVRFFGGWKVCISSRDIHGFQFVSTRIGCWKILIFEIRQFVIRWRLQFTMKIMHTETLQTRAQSSDGALTELELFQMRRHRLFGRSSNGANLFCSRIWVPATLFCHASRLRLFRECLRICRNFKGPDIGSFPNRLG
jgi:hypothetical protein